MKSVTHHSVAPTVTSLPDWYWPHPAECPIREQKRALSRMSIVSQTVAKTYFNIIGVDTHAKKHVYAILSNTGEHVETRDFPATAAGIKRAITWAGRRTGGDASTL